MNSVFKLIEIVGTSSDSYEEAINNAINKASQSLKAISWFEVVEQRGAVKDGKVVEYQVIIKVGFKLVD
ncbi:MAG: dodecin domain-containing protein [Calditrichaceae bacterium]|nr:dodecin domain-containing protein [Calditrichaceae bacterium]MBN2708855.1 dodecin domain-containing protein [Calditrichaceae bacterium]RQV97618.1 MAG: dodecin domain-containing protein [Calditrichota bacterium]